MAAADEVRVTYIGVITDLTQKLHSISGITASETRKMVKEFKDLQKEQIAAIKNTERLATTTKSTSAAATTSVGAVRAGYVNLGNQISDVASQLSTGTSPFTIAVQQGPQAASAIAMMGPAAVTAGAGLAALTAIVAAGYIGWRIYTEDATRAEVITNDLAAAHKALEPLLRNTESASIDLAKELGYLTEEEAKLKHNAIRAFEAYQGATEETRKKLQALTAEQTSFGGAVSQTVQELAKGGWGPYVAVVDALTTSTEEYQQQEDALLGTLAEAAEATRQNVATTANLISAEGANKEKTKASAEAQREYAARLREVARIKAEMVKTVSEANAGDEKASIQAVGDSLDKLDAIRTAADIKALEGIAKVNEQLRVQKAEIEDLANTAMNGGGEAAEVEAKSAAARVAVEAQAAAEIAKIREKEAADAKKAADEKTKAQIAAVDKAVAVATRIADGAANAAEAAYDHQADVANKLREQLVSGDEYYTNAQKKQIAKQIRQHEAAARRAWQIEHGVALASATTNMLVAIGKAASSAPWPLNLIPMAGAAAETVPLVASVASQKPAFHAGYAPDEMDAKILRREAVVTPQGISALGGSGAIRDANAGVPQSGPSVILSTTVYKHGAQTTRIKADGLRRRDPIAKMILQSADTPYWRRKT